MHDHLLGCSLLIEHPEHVGVRVPIMDDQRLTEPLGDRDVRAETLLLAVAAIVTGTEIVQSGLAHAAHPGLRRQALDLPQRPVEIGQPGGLIGVDGNGGEHCMVTLRQHRAPTRRRHVHANLNQPVDPYRGRRRDLLGRVAADNVEMGVTV